MSVTGASDTLALLFHSMAFLSRNVGVAESARRDAAAAKVANSNAESDASVTQLAVRDSSVRTSVASCVKFANFTSFFLTMGLDDVFVVIVVVTGGDSFRAG